jgi:hypothetical protein
MKYNNNINNINNKKTYKIVDFPNTGELYGNYKSTSPKKAAELAFDKLSNLISINNKNEYSSGKFLVFTIRNIDNYKEYKYIGSRIKLENPIKKNINNKEVIMIYKNVIGKYNSALDKI